MENHLRLGVKILNEKTSHEERDVDDSAVWKRRASTDEMGSSKLVIEIYWHKHPPLSSLIKLA